MGGSGGSGVEVDAGDAGGDEGEDFPGDGSGLDGDFADRDVGAEEFDLVTGSAIGEVGDVAHDLVHGDPPEDRDAAAAEKDVGVVVERWRGYPSP